MKYIQLVLIILLVSQTYQNSLLAGFSSSEFSSGGTLRKSVDERTNLISYYFDGASWLQTSTNFGGEYSFAFWATWYEQASWSRIFDFGKGAANFNLVVANEGESNTFFIRAGGNGGTYNDLRCRGDLGIQIAVQTHWAVSVDSNANMVVYKNGQKLNCGVAVRNFNGAVPVTDRPGSFVGKSNWPDALFRGVITDLSFWSGIIDQNFVNNILNNRIFALSNFQNRILSTGERSYDFETYNWQVNGNTRRYSDERTSLTGYYFDGAGDFLQTSTNIGAPFSICFFAQWDQFGSWSRILDWGIGQDRDNILIANEGGSGNFVVHLRKWNRFTVHKCVNLIQVKSYDHYIVTLSATGQIKVFKNGVKVDCNQEGNQNDGIMEAIARPNSFIGKSNWPDALFKGVIEDLAIYRYEMVNLGHIQAYANQRKDRTAQYYAQNNDALTKSPFYRFEDTEFAVQGNVLKQVDDRTGLTRMTFDGSSYLQTTTQFSCPFTIVLYAQWNEFRSWSRLFDFGNGPINNNIVVANEGGSKNLVFQVHQGQNFINVKCANAIDNEVNHWAFTCSADKGGTFKIYKNGVAVDCPVAGNGHDGHLPYMERKNSFIGQSNWPSDGVFKGLMEDFRVYKTLLSPERIAEIAGFRQSQLNNLDKRNRLGQLQTILSFDQTTFNAGGNVRKSLDIRTNQLTYYFDAASWITTSTNFGGVYTVSFWANWYTIQSWSRIMDFGNGPDNNNLIIANEGGSRNLFVRAGKAGLFNDWRCANQINDKVFTHWGVVVNSDAIVNVYKNGVALTCVQAKNFEGLPTVMTRSNSHIGLSNWGRDAKFNGLITDLKIWNEALTPTEVKFLFDQREERLAQWINTNGLKPLYEIGAHDWQVNGNPNKFIDERTGLVSYYFDGDGDFLASSTNIGTPFTAIFWATWDELGSWSRIMDWGMGQNRDNLIIANEGGSRNFMFHNEKWDTSRFLRCTNLIDQGEHAHFAAVMEKNGDMSVYKNGEPINCGAIQGANAVDGLFEAFDRVSSYIGKSNWNSDRLFTGKIEDFKIFGSSLSAAQIKNMFQQRSLKLQNYYNENNAVLIRTPHYTLEGRADYAVGGSPTTKIDERTGLTRAALDGNSHYKFTTKVGCPFTATFYAQWDELKPNSRIFDFTYPGGFSFIRAYNLAASRHFRFEVASGKNIRGLQCNNQIDVNELAHWSLTCDQQGELQIFKNGAKLDCGNYGPNLFNGIAPYIERTESYIGRSERGFNFRGAIEDFRIYKQVLNPEQIADIAAFRQTKIDEANNINRIDDIEQYVSFKQTEFQSGGGIKKSIDERTGYITYYFDKTAWLSTSSNFGGQFSVSWWGYWHSSQSWSRIIDFGNGPNNNNLIIANEAGSRNLIFSIRKGSDERSVKCDNVIDHAKYTHWTTIAKDNGEIEVYKNAVKLECVWRNKNFDGIVDVMDRTNSYVGKSNWNDQLFSGIIAKLQIFGSALNPTEVTFLYNDRAQKINAFIQRSQTPYYTFNHEGWQVNGNPIKSVDPRSGLTGYYFDSDGDWLATSTNLGTPFTVMFWANWADLLSWSRIIDFGVGQNQDNILIANQGGSRHFEVQLRKDDKVARQTCNNLIDAGQWTHFAVVATDTDILVYKNSEAVDCGKVTFVGGIDDVFVPAIDRTQSFMGKSNWGSDRLFKGFIEDFKIFKKAMGTDKIVEDYRRRGNSINQYYNNNQNDLAATPLYSLASEFTVGGQPAKQVDERTGLHTVYFDSNSFLKFADGVNFGTPLTITFYAQWFQFRSWSRIFDFGNGPQSNNILVANEGTSDNLIFSTRVGDRQKNVRCTKITYNMNHWAVQTDLAGNSKVYRNGVLDESCNTYKNDIDYPNFMRRADAFIGKSNWNDQNFQGVIEDFKVYGTILTPAQIQQIAGFRQVKLDQWNQNNRNVYYSFEQTEFENEGNTEKYEDDRSGLISYRFNQNKWLKTTSNFGSPLTVTFYAEWEVQRSWSRIIDFGHGADNNNILIANEGGSNNLIVSLRVANQARQYRCPNLINTLSMNHYGVVVDLNGDVQVYKDGTLVDSCTKYLDQFDGRVPQIFRPNSFVGKSNWADQLFEGIIEDLRIYRVALPASLISQIAQEKRNKIINHANSVRNVIYKSFNSLQITPTGPPTKSVDRQINSIKYDFSGTNQFLTTASNFGAPFAITFYATWAATNSWSRIFDFGVGTNNENILVSNEGGSNNFIFDIRKKAVSTRLNCQNTIPVGEEHHWAVTMNVDLEMKVYRDGNLLDCQKSGPLNPATNKWIHPITRASSLIGKSNWAADQLFKGSIEDFRIYRSELTGDDIKSIANYKTSEKDKYNNQNADKLARLNSHTCTVLYERCDYEGEYLEICDRNPDYGLQWKSIYMPTNIYGIEIFDNTHFNGEKVEYYESVPCMQDDANSLFMMQHHIKYSKLNKNHVVDMNEIDQFGKLIQTAVVFNHNDLETTLEAGEFTDADDIDYAKITEVDPTQGAKADLNETPNQDEADEAFNLLDVDSQQDHVELAAATDMEAQKEIDAEENMYGQDDAAKASNKIEEIGQENLISKKVSVKKNKKHLKSQRL